MISNVFFSHIFFALVLFFIVNWIGKHSSYAGYIQMSVFVKTDEAPAYNFIYRVFTPIAYITILSSALYTVSLDYLVHNIYLVVVYYFLFRVLFNIITERSLLLNWFTQISYMAVSIPMAYFVYKKLILHKEFLFPSSEDIGSAVWLGIIAYLYHTFNNIKLSNERTKKRKDTYLLTKYRKYNQRYNHIVSNIANNEKQERLIYAVLIYESFNRPKVYRIVENMLFFLGFANTLGIMQVNTKQYINDEDSVRLGSEKIVNDYENSLSDESVKNHGNSDYWINRYVLKRYNPDNDYIREVSDLHNELLRKLDVENDYRFY